MEEPFRARGTYMTMQDLLLIVKYLLGENVELYKVKLIHLNHLFNL